jgi:protein-disulfide isomerase
MNPNKTKINDIPVPAALLPRPAYDHIQGPINAPIALIEYGDYECPYCGAAYPMIKAIQERLGDGLCFVFRNFPLADSHPHAQRAAEAAEAAGAQGKFWEMHDILYEYQEDLEDENLAEYAAILGLDVDRFTADLLAGTYAERVRKDFRGGVSGGVNGTPTFFINGILYQGAYDFEELLATLTKAQTR